MKYDMNEDYSPKDRRINAFIQQRLSEGIDSIQLNKELKRKFQVRLKDNPKSKYERHTGAKEKAKAQANLLASGKVVTQAGTTATVSVSYSHPEEQK